MLHEALVLMKNGININETSEAATKRMGGTAKYIST